MARQNRLFGQCFGEMAAIPDHEPVDDNAKRHRLTSNVARPI